MATPTHIIAEAGVNHNGVPDLAFALASAAHSAGADSVKFQTFDSSEIVTSAAGKADYQKQHSDAKESQQAMLARLQLSHGLHRELIQHCDGLGINFLSSAFDLGSLRFLINDLKLSTIKFGSGELLNAPLLYEAARSGVRIIISTGMANMADIEQSLGVLALGMSDVPPERPTRMAFEEAWSDRSLRERVQERVTVLHCTSSYPTPAEYVNLLAMRTIASAFGVPVGYSDHTESGSICVAAVALGARVLEKHLTLDRTMQGLIAASMGQGRLKPWWTVFATSKKRSVLRSRRRPKSNDQSPPWREKVSLRTVQSKQESHSVLTT